MNQVNPTTSDNKLTSPAKIMNEFKFSGPHCQQHLQCNEQLSGRQIECPNCSHLIRVPPVPGKTADYKPESGKTWDTFGPSMRVGPPKALSVRPKQVPTKP